MHSPIATVLRAYAAGDAFGVYYEFREVEVVTPELRQLDGWPYGGVSDDSLLSLMTLATLNEPSANDAASKFLFDLRSAAPQLRGLGPTTRHALGMDVKENESHLIGKSNGAMMRTALCGLAFDKDEDYERNAYVEALARATHSSDDAITCALIAAELFSSPNVNIDAIIAKKYPNRDYWSPPPSGISLDPVETLFAFTMVAQRNTRVLDAYMDACSLGGDTDTVSALAGALVALRNPDSGFDEIPWLSDIDWNEISSLDEIAAQIAERS
jgi:ADP-ribosyl-[dinitrogen reductase] hydrolase